MDIKLITKIFALSQLPLLSSCLGYPDYLVTIKGYVRNPSGEPLPGVEVSLWGFAELTDTNGCFFYKEVSGAREIELRLAAEGYKNSIHRLPFESYQVVFEIESVSSGSENDLKWEILNADQAWEIPGCEST